MIRIHTKSKQLIQKAAAAWRCCLLTLTFAASHSKLPAQSFSEWFKQKKTQKKYLLAQIAALKTYAAALEKGYQLAKTGLGQVAHLKQSNFLQHQLHFNTMTMVGPAVKNNPKVAQVAAMEDQSAGLRRELMQLGGNRGWLSPKEITSLSHFVDQSTRASAKDLATLELLVTTGKLEMTTAERMAQIDALYKTVKQKYLGVFDLTRQIKALIANRKAAKQAVQLTRQLYGIAPE